MKIWLRTVGAAACMLIPREPTLRRNRSTPKAPCDVGLWRVFPAATAGTAPCG